MPDWLSSLLSSFWNTARRPMLFRSKEAMAALFRWPSARGVLQIELSATRTPTRACVVILNEGGTLKSPARLQIKSLTPLTNAEQATPYSGQFVGHYLMPTRQWNTDRILKSDEREEFLVCERRGDGWLYFSADPSQYAGGWCRTPEADYSIELVTISEGAKGNSLPAIIRMVGEANVEISPKTK